MNRGEVYLVNLDSVKGSEQKGTRYCIVVSPSEMNRALNTVIVLPMTSKMKDWPSRVRTEFRSVTGHAICEQVRTIDKKRLIKLMGRLDRFEIDEIRNVLKQIFFD